MFFALYSYSRHASFELMYVQLADTYYYADALIQIRTRKPGGKPLLHTVPRLYRLSYGTVQEFNAKKSNLKKQIVETNCIKFHFYPLFFISLKM